MLINYQKEKE